MADQLSNYRKKRNFSRTSEPGGAKGDGADQSRYVMHMHAASHDHFDLRLEQDGVLRSWALPKGPSLAAGEKRLAVEVEDHPLDYGDFEGVIPQGEYGGGSVMLWDRGHWQRRGKANNDRIDFDLQGQKLQGHWTLVRMRDRQKDGTRRKKNWLLIKRSEAVASEPDDLSVATGRTMEQIARGEAEPEPSQTSAPARLTRARKGAPPDAPTVQLATLAKEPPEGEEWIHELKFDGYRLLAKISSGRVTLTTRNGKDWTRRFPALAKLLSTLPVQHAVIDGELVVQEADGSTSFRRLQEWLSAEGAPADRRKLVYQTFDLLHLDDYDLRRSPLLERKQALADLLEASGDLGEQVRYSDHVQGQGQQFHAQVCEMGLEGMVSKQAAASYRHGRQRSWLKIKCTRQDEFVVGGFSQPSGSRAGFGSLLLGAYYGDRLIYAGRVGSGFSGRQLSLLESQLRALGRKTSPFANEVPDTAGVQWVSPRLVVDVEFTEQTGAGLLRHPVFRGVREDKAASEVHIMADPYSGKGNRRPIHKEQRPGRSKSSEQPVIAGVPITHPDRVLYPEQGITKLDVARYYEAVHDHLLPHLADRPLSLLRCPEGLAGDCFFQKHPDKSFAANVPRTVITEKDGSKARYLYVSSAADLVRLVQFGVLEFHPWGSRITDVDRPDTLIFDLDPGQNVSWRALTQAATSLRERLDSLGLDSFLQASGGKGVHLVVPVHPEWGWEELKAFTRGIARVHAADDPRALTSNMSRAKRRGRVFIDYLRNGRGNTSIARYSTRAREGATVATPLRWNELSASTTANRYTLRNLPRRLSALKKDPWEDYEEARNRIDKKLLNHYTGA